MSKQVAIVQSNYVPWKGYFDLINRVDEFILFDEVQYAKKSWRNRNCIKTVDGLFWLTIPINVKGKLTQKISEATMLDHAWKQKHLKTIRMAYLKADCFEEYYDFVEDLYTLDTLNLSESNKYIIEKICKCLNITTKITTSSDYGYIHEEGSIRPIADLVLAAGGTVFINGPTAKGYMSEDQFLEYGVNLRWMDYSGYKEYPQLHSPFEHAVSILDLILNCGSSSSDYLL